MRKLPLMPLLVSLMLAQEALAADARGGRVVWWAGYPDAVVGSGGSNGVVAWQGEVLTNVVAVAAHGGGALLLRNDGTVLSWRTTLNEPCAPLTIDGQPLTNVAAVSADDGGAWAFRRDGAVVECDPWGRNAAVLPGLTNVIAVARVSNGRLLAVRRDGTVLCQMSPAEWVAVGGDPYSLPTTVASVGGHPLTNVVALTDAPGLLEGDCLALQSDGTVLALWLDSRDYGIADFSGPDHPVTAHQVAVDGEVLTNIVAVTCFGGNFRALQTDGTALAWNFSQHREALPLGLRGLAAILPSGDIALRRDGTLVMWGSYTNLPAGLGGIIAIAAGLNFYLAVTTNAPLPSSVFIPPQGRLEEMEREADLLFKGRAFSTRAITNASFPSWGNPHATQFEVISVLKGSIHTNVLLFEHNTSGPNAWGGGTPPPHYIFEVGQSYLIFADKTGKPGVFRQLTPMLRSETDGVTRTLDSRPLAGLTIKEAHWLELSRLLASGAPTNALYAIRRLQAMSPSCVGPWGHTDDFKREAVLSVLLPLITNPSDRVAVAAIGCFQVGGNTGTLFTDGEGWMPILRGCCEVRPECVDRVAPYAVTLAAVAGTSPSIPRRVAAIAAFSCTGLPVVKDSLPQWLRDPADAARAQAVLLLPDFPGDFAEGALREGAADASPKVRAAVADAIGNGKIEPLLPTLEKLFSAPVGPTNPAPPLTLEDLQAGAQLFEANVGDVHTSAGYALLKFDADQMGAFLNTNLSDAGFRISFLCKLAEQGAGPWLNDLAAVMEERRTQNQKKAAASGVEPRANYFESLMYLSGNYAQCWSIIYSHLHDLPKEQFAAAKMDRYLDVLENAGGSGSREPLMIYELYRMKGLGDRARSFRSRTENKFAVYNIRQFYDKVDATYTNSPSRSDR